MAEFMNGMKRTDYCASFSESDVGKEITVMGWTDGRRDLGSLIFVDLRDRTGILQIVFDESVLDKAVFEKATTIRHEFVLAAKGTLRIRSSINENIPTGRIELLVELGRLGQSIKGALMHTGGYEIISCALGRGFAQEGRFDF